MVTLVMQRGLPVLLAAAHLLLCSPGPNRSWTSTVGDPASWGPLL